MTIMPLPREGLGVGSITKSPKTINPAMKEIAVLVCAVLIDSLLLLERQTFPDFSTLRVSAFFGWI